MRKRWVVEIFEPLRGEEGKDEKIISCFKDFRIFNSVKVKL